MINKTIEKLIEQARTEAAAQATEDMKTTLSGLQEEQAKMLEKSAQMGKELSVKGDADIVRVMLIFDNLQVNHSQIIEGLKIIALKDPQKANKLGAGISSYLSNNALPELKALEV